MMAADVNSARGVEVIKFLVARHERLEALEKVGQPAVTDFSDPVAVCKLYLEAEEGRRQLKLENLAANQVIGETKAILVNTEIKLETAEDRIEILLNKIELPKVSILIEEFCHTYGNLLGVTEGNLFKLLYRHKILRETDRGPVPYTTRTSHAHFDISSEEFFNSKRGRMDVRTTTRLTPAGVAWLRDWLLQHGPRRAARVADAVSATQQGILSGN